MALEIRKKENLVLKIDPKTKITVNEGAASVILEVKQVIDSYPEAVKTEINFNCSPQELYSLGRELCAYATRNYPSEFAGSDNR